MKHTRLINITDKYFHKAWELYEDAFPVEERRTLDVQSSLMKIPNYHFDISFDDKQFIGFLLWWEFKSVRYIDHFATSVQLRNKGFGKLILEKFINSNERSILLEVELPDSTINRRRIKFYEKIGFILNQHYYEIPPAEESQSPLQLMLMSYPTRLSKNDVAQFIKVCHPVIFHD